MVYNPNAQLPQQPNHDPWSRQGSEVAAQQPPLQPTYEYPVAPPVVIAPPAPVYYEQPVPPVAQYALPPAPVYAAPNHPTLYEPAPVAPTVPEKKRKGISKLTAALVGATVVSVGGAAAIVAIANQKANERVAEIKGDTGSGSSYSAEPFPGQGAEPRPLILGDINRDNILTQEEANALTIDEYASLDPSIRAEHKNEALNMYLHTAWDSIQPHLTEDEKKVLYLPDLNKPRAKWTDQDYLNQHALAVWLASTQGDNTLEGMQSYAAITSPDKEGFDEVITYIKNNPGMGVKNIYEAVPTPLTNVELPNMTIGSIETDSNGGRVIGHRKVGGTRVDYTVYSNTSDSKDNLVPVVETTYDSIQDPDLVRVIKKVGR